MKTLSETIADEINNYTHRTGKNLADLAEETGITKGALSRFMSGERTQLRMSTIDALMRALKLKIVREK